MGVLLRVHFTAPVVAPVMHKWLFETCTAHGKPANLSDQMKSNQMNVVLEEKISLRHSLQKKKMFVDRQTTLYLFSAQYLLFSFESQGMTKEFFKRYNAKWNNPLPPPQIIFSFF